jgi:hypothetical protein
MARCHDCHSTHWQVLNYAYAQSILRFCCRYTRSQSQGCSLGLYTPFFGTSRSISSFNVSFTSLRVPHYRMITLLFESDRLLASFKLQCQQDQCHLIFPPRFCPIPLAYKWTPWAVDNMWQWLQAYTSTSNVPSADNRAISTSKLISPGADISLSVEPPTCTVNRFSADDSAVRNR